MCPLLFCVSASNRYFLSSSHFKKAMVEIAVIQMILEVRRKKMTLREREVRRTRKKVKMKN